jgi:hypothetical protein
MPRRLGWILEGVTVNYGNSMSRRSMQTQLVGLLALTILSVSPLVARGALSFMPLGEKVKASSARGERGGGGSAALVCDSAADLAIGATVSGTTVGAPNNVSTYACSEWNESGGEVVYRLSITSPQWIEISLTSDCDLDVALLSGCDAGADCLIVGDTGVRSSAPVSGEFYVVVDGFNGASCDFQISVTAFVPSVADPAVCASAELTSCVYPDGTLQGTTCGNSDSIRDLECAYSLADGADRSYRFRVQPRGWIVATLSMPTADGVLWLLGECGEATECLAYSDTGLDGEDEAVIYQNLTGVPQNIYLVVDSFDEASCAEFTVDLRCNGTVVGVEGTSWSTLKDRYALPASSTAEVDHE